MKEHIPYLFSIAIHIPELQRPLRLLLIDYRRLAFRRMDFGMGASAVPLVDNYSFEGLAAQRTYKRHALDQRRQSRFRFKDPIVGSHHTCSISSVVMLVTRLPGYVLPSSSIISLDHAP